MNKNFLDNDGNDHIDDAWALLLENLHGESSLETVIECGESSDRDLHNKRAKVFSGSHDFHFSTAVSSAADGSISAFGHRSNGVKGKETWSHIFSWNNSCDESSSGAAGMLEDRGQSGDSEMEDLEVQMDLTGDLLHMVFSFLDYANLCRAAMVCRQWRAASAHEEFWRCLNFENRNISLSRFQDMCRRYPNATQVNVYGVPDMHLLAMEAVSSLRNLESLTLGRGQLGDAFPFALADCSMLRSLNVYDAILGSGIQEITIDHDRLHHLQLSKCRLSRISVRCMQLKTLSLKRSTMTQAALSCPLLHLLDIGSCHKLSDAAIRSAVTSCPQLESLDISNCSCVTDETLREITITCPSLQCLDASYCPNISLELVVLSGLTVLKLHSCEGITSASMSAINNCTMLEIVELDNCNLLTSVSLNLTRLQNIRLVHCRKLLDLDLQAVMLSSIMVSNCPALLGIHITSDCLQKLSLPKQENLVILELQCKCLQEVDLTDCESLSDSILEMFNDGGGCPKLKSLVLDDCEGLTSVKFSSSSLVSLSLVDCRKVTDLELECHCLEEVYLDGCDHLETASFCPVALQSLNLGICPKLKMLNIEAKQMVSLELKGCGILSRASICCPLLKSLDASFCSQLPDECLSATTRSCPLIESLVLMSCPSLEADGLYSLHWLPHLTMLDLSYTFLTYLKPVFESCSQLKVLKLQACKYLTDTSLEPLYKEDALPMLQELDLSYGTFCQSVIVELLSCCTQLTHVSLNGCVDMHDLDWGSGGEEPYKWTAISGSSSLFPCINIHETIEQPNHLLQNLNCVGCPNIRKVLISPVASCVNLSSLNLALSVNLKEVDIACLNLNSLNLSNCFSLESLKLRCPRLTSLFIQSCNIDETFILDAISQCTMLETLDVRYCPKISATSMRRLRAACPSIKRIYSSLPPL